MEILLAADAVDASLQILSEADLQLSNRETNLFRDHLRGIADHLDHILANDPTDMESIRQALSEIARDDETFWVVKPDGTVVVTSELSPDAVAPANKTVAPLDLIGPALGKGSKDHDIQNSPSGRRYLVGVKLPENDFVLLGSRFKSSKSDMPLAHRLPHDLFTRSVQHRFAETQSMIIGGSLVIFIIGMLFAVLIAIWISSSVAKPINQLIESLESYDGRKPISIDVKRYDEMGLLAMTFHKMTEKLAAIQGELYTKQQALEKADMEMMELNLQLEDRITKRTKKLQQALEELKSLDKSKDDFVSLITHELKTPLTSIAASAEALNAGDFRDDPSQRKLFLRIIQDEAGRLTRLINDVLDLTRMESKRMPFYFIPTNLPALLEQVVTTHKISAGQEQIELTFSYKIKDRRLESVPIDPDRVIQVMTNLLSNAIKFTSSGGKVSVELSLYSPRKNKSKLPEMALITVTDTGIGIKSEDRRKVFDRFQQIERVD